jgi:hypothetical protein
VRWKRLRKSARYLKLAYKLFFSAIGAIGALDAFDATE